MNERDLRAKMCFLAKQETKWDYCPNDKNKNFKQWSQEMSQYYQSKGTCAVCHQYLKEDE